MLTLTFTAYLPRDLASPAIQLQHLLSKKDLGNASGRA